MNQDERYFIGGSPCSGKSSIANALASQFNLTTYHCDEHFSEHSNLASPQRQPIMNRLSRMTCDDIWLESVDAQVERVFKIFTEEFPMIEFDLAELSGKVVIEGTALLPEQLFRLTQSPERCIYLIPSPTFQMTHYIQREWRHEVLRDCSNPAQAFENWMERDYQFGQQLMLEATKHSFTCVIVDEDHDLDFYSNLVASHFGLR